MKIFFMLFFCFAVFAQEEDNCTQELEKNCKEATEIYKCLIADPTNKEKKFSEKCWPKFRKDLESGKYSHPCLDEMKSTCPGGDAKCFIQRKASLSSDCQEFLGDGGIPQAPKQEELNKVIETCKPETEVSCGVLDIEVQVAERDGKTEEAKKKFEEYKECMKNAFLKPKDPKCGEAFKGYRESLQKEAPAGSGDRYEIK